MASVPLLGVPLLSSAAGAEERDPFAPLPPLPLLREGVAGTRQIPGYAPVPVKAGPFEVSPEITARSSGDSNVLTTRTGQLGDVAFSLAPAVTAVTTAGDAQVALGARASAVRYAKLTAQNYETFALQAQAAHPIGKAFTFGLSGSWALKAEPNYSATAAEADTPTRFHQLSGTVGLAAATGPQRISATLDFDRYDYLTVRRSGVQVSQAFRDQRVVTAGLKAEHALPAGRTLFAQGRYGWADSLNVTPTFDRTWRGGEAVVGLRGDLAPLVSAEIAAGYQWRGYRSPAFRDWSGIAYRAKVEWYATPLLSLQGLARRDIVDPGLPGASGVIIDAASVRAFYEVRRNVNLIASAGYSHESYRDVPATALAGGLAARTLSAGLEATYALSSHYLVGAYARYRNRSSDSALLARLGGAVEGGLSLRLKL